jgi:hypothetical protein
VTLCLGDAVWGSCYFDVYRTSCLLSEPTCWSCVLRGHILHVVCCCMASHNIGNFRSVGQCIVAAQLCCGFECRQHLACKASKQAATPEAVAVLFAACTLTSMCMCYCSSCIYGRLNSASACTAVLKGQATLRFVHLITLQHVPQHHAAGLVSLTVLQA